jgi:phage terminase Nu1 subunit (DNA packaging protein)
MTRRVPRPPPFPTDLARDEICQLLGVSVSRLAQLGAEGIVIPTAVRGRYSTASVTNYVEHLRQRNAPSAPQALQQAKTAWTHEKIQIARIEKAARQGELVPVREVREAFMRAFGAVRARVLQLPSKLAVRLAAAETAVQAQEIIRDECVELLNDSVHGVVEFRGSKGPSRRGRPSKAVVDVEAAEEVTAAE